VRDLRTQVAAAVTTLVAAIAGFYFGAQTATASAGGQSQPKPTSAPKLGPDPNNRSATFTIGQPGTYMPMLTGNPAPTVILGTGDQLPNDLQLDPNTGAITGTPQAGSSAPSYNVKLVAKNGISPDAELTVQLTIVNG
jgi:hypothetical protein